MIVESYEDVVVISGSLMSNHWTTLHTALSLQLKRHPAGVIIDCSGLKEANEHGADTFRNVMEFIEDHHARVLLAAIPANIMEVLRKVPDVRSQLVSTATVEEARRSLYLLSDPEEEGKRKAVAARAQHLLVCLTGDKTDSVVLEMGCNLADGYSGSILAVFPILISRDLPLQAAMPEQEELASKVLGAAEEVLEKNKIPYEISVQRGRDLASALTDILEQHPVSHVVIGIPEDNGVTSSGKVMQSITDKLSEALVFVRGPKNS